jgi:hypothetical protein
MRWDISDNVIYGNVYILNQASTGINISTGSFGFRCGELMFQRTVG